MKERKFTLARRLGDVRLVQMLPGETMSMGFIDRVKVIECSPMTDAAPDLYEALEGIITAMEGLGHGPFEHERAALAKARGE